MLWISCAESLVQKVMRSSWHWLALGGVMLFLIGIAYELSKRLGDASGSVHLTVVDHHIEGESLVISVLTSNAGSAVLLNGGNVEVRCQIAGAWTTNSLPGLRSCHFWLLPGQTHWQRIRLARSVSRFQVGALYEVAQARAAAVCRLYSSPLPRQVGAVLASAVNLLPYHRGPDIEYWDDEHAVAIEQN